VAAHHVNIVWSNILASFSIFPIYVGADAHGFFAYIAPLDGGLHVLARSSCPSRARELGRRELRRLDQINNRQSA